MLTAEPKTTSVATRAKTSPSFFSKKGEESFFGKNIQGQASFFNPSSTYSVSGKGILQTKLTIGQPDDKYEKEADKMADKVVQRMADSSIQRKCAHCESAFAKASADKEEEKKEKVVQRKCAACEKEDKEKLQKKSESPGSTALSPDIESKLNSSRGNGNSLPENLRTQMEYSFGSDFSNVRLHTDSSAVQMNKDLHAQAFTHGSDIYFNTGKYNTNTAGGKHLLAHELTHVVQQGGNENIKTNTQTKRSNINLNPSSSTLFRQGLLTPAQERSAIFFNNSRFDFRSRMIIQIITGTTVDGIIGTQTVESIAAFQNANGLTEDGKVGENTLNAMFRDRVAAGSQDQAIQLVVDFFNLDLSQTLSITFDPTLFLANTTFEPGGQRVIRVGTIAFLGADFLRTVIASQLAIPAPAVPAIGPRPNHLSAGEEIAASNFNRSKYADPRSIRGLQGFVGSNPDGIFGPDTAERIAEFQNTNGLTVDGKAGENTLRVIVQQLDAANQQNLAIRLIIDFFNFSEHNALLDISFDPSLTTANASTGGDIPGPSRVRIGPPAFAQGFEGLVHTIEHELEHVRQRKEGILNQDEREFLAEAVEILSIGTPEENVAGFFDDARRALARWNNLPAADQRRLFNRFTTVRNKVRQRFNAATPAEQVVHQPTLDGYNAVVRP